MTTTIRPRLMPSSDRSESPRQPVGPRPFAWLALSLPILSAVLCYFLLFAGAASNAFELLIASAVLPPVLALVFAIIALVRREAARGLLWLAGLLSCLPAVFVYAVLGNMSLPL